MAIGFDISNTSKPVNDTLVVNFLPSTDTTQYSYKLYKDGNVIKNENITNNQGVHFPLTDTGNYYIEVSTVSSAGEVNNYTSGVYQIDKEKPIINVPDEIIITSRDQNINVTATDNVDGDITSSITSDISLQDIYNNGTHMVTYVVSDAAGNVASKSVYVNTEIVGNYLFVAQAVIVICVVLLGLLIRSFFKTLKLGKRIEAFTIEPMKTNNVPLADRILMRYRRILDKFGNLFNKSEFFKKYAKRFDKYASISVLHNSGMEIVCGKITCAILFGLFVIMNKTLRWEPFEIYDFVLPFVLGYFVLDVIYIVKYKRYRIKLENDFLAAITVMNNAFKAGRSISQAIDIVSREVAGPIGSEFEKMSLELSYGLGIDVVFKRFGERINLEEVSYLTASLTILNKTGGNITEVFDSIEKSLFNKKKLRLELRTLTASSRLIIYVIILVPLCFILFVNVISPGYFEPFFNTGVGNILLILMIMFYIIFIYFVKKIMKVVI